MLAQLHIENVAVIERAELQLGPGLTVLTGETGAGKSILIDSINLALGERTSRDIVRTGAKAAQVSALFTAVAPRVQTRAAELGFPCAEDGSLLLSREITADGRGTCRVGGRPATVSILREIGRLLVNIHGQHDNQALLQPENHIRYLDLYAAQPDLLAEYTGVYTRLRALRAKLRRLTADEAQQVQRADARRLAAEEIEAARLKPGEEAQLIERRAAAANAEKIAQALQTATGALDGGEEAPGALSLLESAVSAAQAAAAALPSLAPLAARLESLRYEAQDCAAELRGRMEQTDAAPGSLEQIEERLDVLYRLKTRYGGSVEAVIAAGQQAREELARLETAGTQAQALRREGAQLAQQAKALAARLSQARGRAAATMQAEIARTLSFLEMPGVRFAVDIQPLQRLEATGADKVEFLLAANPGAPLRPLAKIASGGEISRVMLAIKSVLAGVDDIDTLVFDEIDTGVSGRAAYQIGVKLKEVAQARQCMCVTHLAQIAAQARRHVLIEKAVCAGTTRTTLRVLDFEGRKRELARIIGGLTPTPLTLQSAEEMLRAAGVSPETADGADAS